MAHTLWIRAAAFIMSLAVSVNKDNSFNSCNDHEIKAGSSYLSTSYILKHRHGHRFPALQDKLSVLHRLRPCHSMNGSSLLPSGSTLIRPCLTIVTDTHPTCSWGNTVLFSLLHLCCHPRLAEVDYPFHHSCPVRPMPLELLVAHSPRQICSSTEPRSIIGSGPVA
jgi:hypothetical protein